jgi:hypothetical protein
MDEERERRPLAGRLNGYCSQAMLVALKGCLLRSREACFAQGMLIALKG